MSTQHRIHRTKEQWQRLILDQIDSGLTQAAFCRQQSLSLASFGNWKRRLQKDQADDADAHWLELPALPAASSGGWDIELDLGNGVCLRLKQQ